MDVGVGKDIGLSVQVRNQDVETLEYNRDNSFDSRYWVETNFVPEEMLVGQAVSIWLHLDFDITTKGLTWIPTGIDIGRIGSIK